MKGVAEAFSYSKSARLGLEAGVDLFLVCRREDALNDAVQEVVAMLLAGAEQAERVLSAIGRVRKLRATLARPAPSTAAVATVTDDSEARRLREILGIGTV